MTLSLMRFVDRFAGIPLCWAAGIIRMIIPPRKRTVNPAGAAEILVIKFFGMGSIILGSSALRLIRSAFPSARVTFVSFESNRTLLERYPVDDILTVDDRGIVRFAVTTGRLVRRLAAGRYDIVFDFEFFSKFSTLLSAITRAPWRVGFALPVRWREWHLTHGISLSKERHVTEAFCDQVRALAGNLETPGIAAPLITHHDTVSVRHKIAALAGSVEPGRPAIAVNVNAGETFPERRWPPDRFASLIGELGTHSPDALFYFTGSDSDRGYVQKAIDLVEAPDRCRNIAGLFDLPELAAFLRECDLVISNDTGPLHLAAAVGAPAVGLYGPETPVFYGPFAAQARTVYKQVECSPCMNVYSAKAFRCPFGARCMHEIEVADVLQVVNVPLEAE